MAMKDLGRKIKNHSGLYEEEVADKTPKVIYPEIDFELSVVEGLGLKVDDNVDIHIKGRVSGMEDTRFRKRISFEAKKGDISKTAKKDTSLIDEG